MITEIRFSAKAQRQLKKYKKKRQIPDHALDKLQTWVETVENFGISHAQKVPQFHDHALKGDWQGFRSIYLDMTTWRAIYRIKVTTNQDGDETVEIEFVEVEEVNPHEY